MFNINLKEVYSLSKLLPDIDNDFDVIGDMIEIIPELENIAKIGKDDFQRNMLAIDDTTNVYVGNLISAAKELAEMFDKLAEEFLGISEEERVKAIELFDKFLLSYSLILFKVVGYESVGSHLATGNKSLSNLTLPKDLLGKEEAELVEVLGYILLIFKEQDAYFAEYEIGDQEVLDDLMNYLDVSDERRGSLKIASLTRSQTDKQVKKIVGGD